MLGEKEGDYMSSPYRSMQEVEMINYTPEQLEGPPEPYKPPFKVTHKTYKVGEFQFSHGQRIRVTSGGSNIELNILVSPDIHRDQALFTPVELDGFISFLQGLSKA